MAGLATYPSLADVPDPPDLVVVAVPADQVAAVMTDVCAAGAGAAIIVSPGYAGPDQPVGRGLLELARAHSVRMVGPNSQGVLSRTEDSTFNASFARESATRRRSRGGRPVGRRGLHGPRPGARSGVGVHSFVSLGAKLDVSSNDLLAAWATTSG